MRYVVAVSGGVDSVVLLDLMARQPSRVVVAHVDHGMRPEAAAEARFVVALAARYGVACVTTQLHLGPNASEATARQQRYAFLRHVAQQYQALIVTAHHRDDVIETMALNIQRGTRWRGIAGLTMAEVVRPLHGWTKRRILEYAVRHRLEWCDDASNASDRYARNRLRRRLNQRVSAADQQQLYQLWLRQRRLRHQIEQLGQAYLPQLTRRYVVIQTDPQVAQELLYQRARQLGVSLLSEQLERMWLAIKTGRPGTTWQIGGAIQMKLTTKNVTIERVELD